MDYNNGTSETFGRIFSKAKREGIGQTWGFPVTFSSHVSVQGFNVAFYPEKNSRGLHIVTNVTKKSGRCW